MSESSAVAAAVIQCLPLSEQQQDYLRVAFIAQLDKGWLRVERNKHLRKAAAILSRDNPPERVVPLLRAELRRFESTTWQRTINRLRPPQGVSELRSCLWHAFRCGPVPGSKQGLYDAIYDESSDGP